METLTIIGNGLLMVNPKMGAFIYKGSAMAIYFERLSELKKFNQDPIGETPIAAVSDLGHMIGDDMAEKHPQLTIGNKKERKDLYDKAYSALVQFSIEHPDIVD